MDASEIYSKRFNAKEVIFPKEGEFTFPIAEGRIKTPGEDQALRTSTLIRPRPIQGEGHVDFLGESEGSLPPPHDSFPDAGEAINDFWSMSGNFIYRHHVEPRVNLYSPREESFPFPLKYMNVSRTTHTNLDVKQEKRIDDYWNVDGSRVLSDPWTGFTQFTLLEEKPSRRMCVVRREINEKPADIQARSLMAINLENNGKERQAGRRSKSGRMKRSIWRSHENCEESYVIDPEVNEFKETIKNARKNLESSVAPARPCTKMKNCGSGA